MKDKIDDVACGTERPSPGSCCQPPPAKSPERKPSSEPGDSTGLEAEEVACCGSSQKTDQTACCSVSASAVGSAHSSAKAQWRAGTVDTPAGAVPLVTTALTWRDHVGTWKARWSIGRESYTIPPGLYGVGSPTPRSPVLVTANYKMSFDRLRSNLSGRDAWILVLETNGINVWCAAGKGTFGTEELVRRMKETRLEEVVSHRKLILPQLGATGVSAHRVHEQSGWRVIYGPVRAENLPSFLDARNKTTPAMRQVRFTLVDRLVLVPVEVVGAAKYFVLLAFCFLLLSGLGSDGYLSSRILDVGLRSLIFLLLAYLAGAAIAPILLPWLPGRAFSIKGVWAGMLMLLAVFLAGGIERGASWNWAEFSAWVLLVPTISSFLAMNFTGASTYTSLSGVKREMRFAVPPQIAGAAAGLTLWVVGRFV